MGGVVDMKVERETRIYVIAHGIDRFFFHPPKKKSDHKRERASSEEKSISLILQTGTESMTE